MLSVALRPKYLGLLALMVAATLVCGLLANWQWNRAHESMENTATVQEAAPVPLESLQKVGEPVTNDIQGRLVQVTGRFVPEHDAVSPHREIDSRAAAVVLTDFEITEGALKGTKVPVARGFVDDTPSGVRSVPAPPAGELTLVARLEASEGASDGINTYSGTDVPSLATISSPLLVNIWGGPMMMSYLSVTEPALTHTAKIDAATARELSTGVSPLPAAESQFSAGLNLQNFGYMIQWLIFGVFFLYIWWRSVRSTYLDEQAERRLELESRLAGETSD